MGFFSRMDRASVLYTGMAERLGVDPAHDVGQPAGAAAYRAAVLRCSNCTQAEACAGWQVEHAQADHAPGYCRNRLALEALRDA